MSAGWPEQLTLEEIAPGGDPRIDRTVAMAWFLLNELARSLLIIAPLALTLTLYWIFFEWPSNMDYFAATGGFTQHGGRHS